MVSLVLRVSPLCGRLCSLLTVCPLMPTWLLLLNQPGQARQDATASRKRAAVTSEQTAFRCAARSGSRPKIEIRLDRMQESSLLSSSNAFALETTRLNCYGLASASIGTGYGKIAMTASTRGTGITLHEPPPSAKILPNLQKKTQIRGGATCTAQQPGSKLPEAGRCRGCGCGCCCCRTLSFTCQSPYS